MSGFAIANAIGFNYAGFYPTSIPNCKLWLDATRIHAQGYSLDFDGTDDYVQADNVITSYPFTFECWVKTDTTGSAQGLVHINRTTSASIYYGITLTSSRFAIQARNTTIYTNTGTTNYAANTWYHVAGVFVSETERKLYVNGILEVTATDSVSFSNNADNKVLFGLFRILTPSSYLNGRLSDIRIWNTARTEQQIKDNYQKRLVGNETGLVGYWKLDEGTSTSAKDYTSNAKDGTITGAIWSNEEPFTEPISDNTAVRSWTDLSGNNYHATQTTTANRPTFRTNQINGKPAVIFDGSNDYLEATNVITSYPFTMISLVKLNVTTNQIFLSLSDTTVSNKYYALGNITRFSIRARNTTDFITTGTTLISTSTSYNAMGIWESETSRKLYVNKSLEATGTSSVTFNNTLNNKILLGVYRVVSPVNYLNGLFGEIIIYNRILTSGEISTVYNYLKQKWDL